MDRGASVKGQGESENTVSRKYWCKWAIDVARRIVRESRSMEKGHGPRRKGLSTLSTKPTFQRLGHARSDAESGCFSSEGYERGGRKEYIRYLTISKGSSGELRCLLTVACQLKYLSKEVGVDVLNDAVEVSKMLKGLINSLSPDRD